MKSWRAPAVVTRYWHCALLAGAVVAYKLFYALHHATQTDVDTVLFLKMAHLPLTAAALWMGLRPPVAPLLYKALGADLRAIGLAQAVLSLLCWLLLAVAVASTVRHPVARFAAFGTMLGLSLCRSVHQWERIALSESLSFSFLALAVAAWLWCLQRFTPWRGLAVVATTLLFVLTRDTNAYLLLLAIVGVALGTARHHLPKSYYAVIAACVVIAGISLQTANIGLRWQFPLRNSLGRRILPNPQATAFFARHGMPVTPALLELKGQWASGNDDQFNRDPRLAGYRRWEQRHGKATYILWLASNPVMVWSELEERSIQLLDFNFEKSYESSIGTWLDGYLWCSLDTLSSLTIPLTLTVALLWFNGYRRVTLTVGVFLLLATVPLAAVIYWGDPMEIARHGMMAQVQCRVGLWLTVIGILDVVTYQERDAAPCVLHPWWFL
jgi:hypothetical protein